MNSSSASDDQCPAAVAVAGLARTVEALERRVSELARLDQRVDSLADTLARAVMDMPSRIATDTPPDIAVSWLNRPSEAGNDRGASCAAHEAAQQLTQLADWVARVYLRYSDARLPDCWLWHPDVVEELMWLHAAWKAAYHPDASVHAVGDWHDRQRPGVVGRVKGYAGICALEAHLPTGECHVPAATPPTADAAHEIAGWWSTRREQPGPIPTPQQLAAATERLRRTRL